MKSEYNLSINTGLIKKVIVMFYTKACLMGLVKLVASNIQPPRSQLDLFQAHFLNIVSSL